MHLMQQSERENGERERETARGEREGRRVRDREKEGESEGGERERESQLLSYHDYIISLLTLLVLLRSAEQLTPPVFGTMQAGPRW